MRLIAARVLAVLAAFVGMLSFAVERTVLDESGVEQRDEGLWAGANEATDDR